MHCSVLVYLQVIQQRTSEAHFSQRHVRVAAVQEPLDLSADIQSQRLSPLDLVGRKSRSCVIELLQTLLHTRKSDEKTLVTPPLGIRTAVS